MSCHFHIQKMKDTRIININDNYYSIITGCYYYYLLELHYATHASHDSYASYASHAFHANSASHSARLDDNY